MRLLDFYRRWLSPALHAAGGWSGACRFQPTCSDYAEAVWMQHGPLRGSALVLYRLLRCHPFCRGGYDPPPGIGSPAGNGGANGARHLP